MSQRASTGRPAAQQRRSRPRFTWSGFSRLVGTAMLAEQTVSHLLGLRPELLLVGGGLVLLAGRDGLEFMAMVIPRGPAPPSGQ